MIENEEHTRISPSKLERIILCPASLVLSEEVPAQPSNAAAQRGTKLHERMAAFFRNYVTIPPTAGQTPYIDLSKYDDLRTPLQATLALLDGAKPQGIEDKVQISQDISGTIDLWWKTPEALHILDYKFGYNLVPIKRNAQLMAYALGLLDSLKSKSLPSTILLHIVQPAISPEPSTFETSPQELATWWMQEALPAIIKASSPVAKAYTQPSRKACKYCPAAAICAPRQAVALTEASALASSLGHPSLSEEEVFAAYEKSLSLKDLIASTEAYVKSLLARGPRNGFKLVRARGHREWVPEAAVKLQELFPHDLKYLKTELRTPSEVLKMYKDSKNEISSLIRLVEGASISIVSDDDARPGIILKEEEE